jgi:hypothetical protein
MAGHKHACFPQGQLEIEQGRIIAHGFAYDLAEGTKFTLKKAGSGERIATEIIFRLPAIQAGLL